MSNEAAPAWVPKVQVDTLGFLANNLRGYEPTSILREQLQNADDATYKQNRRGELRMQFLPDRLVVTNPSLFSEVDWDRLLAPNSRGKIADAEQTGEFGVGFWGSLHLTDAPIVTSGSREVTLHPETPSVRTVELLDGTSVAFPYRRARTELGLRLEAEPVTADLEARMEAEFVSQMGELQLFTRAVETISITLRDGRTQRATRDEKRIAPNVVRLAVVMDGEPDDDCEYLVVRGEVPAPPSGRHGRVSVAMPITERHRGPGRAFFMFPTETDTGMHLSVDAHFRATDDRRSLENSGPHGAWNDRIFEAAGHAVGLAIETVLAPAHHGLDFEDAISWFVPAGDHHEHIRRRAALFTAGLDAAARQRAVIPDRSGVLRRGADLVDLPATVERILSEAVGDVARPAVRDTTRAVYRRWGLPTWGPPEVASWLSNESPRTVTPLGDAPLFLQAAGDLRTLLDFCRGQERTLTGSSMLLGTDGNLHPIGSGLARPATGHEHLVTGLRRPVVATEFHGTWAAAMAPTTTPQWLREAFMESAAELVGRHVPFPSVGVGSKQANVAEAIDIVSRTKAGLEGTPLALDEKSYLRIFDDTTTVGLPDAGRKEAEEIARRLGLTPLHRSIDTERARSAGSSFGVSLVVELIPMVGDWHSTTDSRLLVEVLASIAASTTISPFLIDRLRALTIWGGSDGRAHELSELRLPARDVLTRATHTLLAADLVGDVRPSAVVYGTFHDLLRVDVLDTTEELVLACENPPPRRADQLQLLLDLGDCGQLSPNQLDRLKRAAFVLCADGNLRTPAAALRCRERLPLGLADRVVVEKARDDRRVRPRLEELGVPELPSRGDLLDVATEIARLGPDVEPDPGQVLWEFLVERFERYGSSIGDLASIPWLLATPGRTRTKPRQCYDPNLRFASMLFAVPIGIATPRRELREALHLRANLRPEDYDALAHRSAERGERLPDEYFRRADELCRGGDAGSRRLAELRTLPIVHLRSGSDVAVVAPNTLVAPNQAAVWGHLRQLVPSQLAPYSSLLRCWGIDDSSHIIWSDHVEVLQALALQEELSRDDLRLARARVSSLTACNLDDHQFETLRQHCPLLTTLGLRPFADVLRADLPPPVVHRLGKLLAIAEENLDTTDFLDQLGPQSLRAAVTLDPLPEGERDDPHWPAILRRQSANVLRFLKASGARLDRGLLQAWPPIVRGVSSLAVRASYDGRVLDEWTTEAHLSEDEHGLVLFVAAESLDAKAIVDAISSEFEIDRGKKTLLLGVLNAPTTEAGAEMLQWDGIPTLTDDEAAYLFQHDPTELAFADSPSVEDASDDDQFFERSSGSDDGDVDSDATATVPAAVDPPVTRNPPPVGPTVEPTPKTEDAGRDPVPFDDEDDDGRSFEPDRAQSPRGVTDLDELGDQGIVVVRDLDDEAEEDDYRPPPRRDEPARKDEVRLCLSFYDVSLGLLPLDAKEVSWLASGVSLTEIAIFGTTVHATRLGQRHVAVDDGVALFHSRQVVAGTVMRAYPSTPGRIEIDVRPEIHHVDGVWLLEIGDDGNLSRWRQDDVELVWETDDAFYKAERRLEDIDALMRDGGKSAKHLILDVFLARDGEGLTIDEIWGLVAISRLFARSTIAQTMSAQTGLFESRDGRWYKVGNELRMDRQRRKAEPASRSETAARGGSEAIKLARRLAQLLATADATTIARVVQLLGIAGMLEDDMFAESCQRYIQTPKEEVLEAISREMQSDPGRAAIAVRQLDAAHTAELRKARPLLERARLHGSAWSVTKAASLIARVDALDGLVGSDPTEEVRQLSVAVADDAAPPALLTEAVERMWLDRPEGDPLSDPSSWLALVAEREAAHRQASQATALTDRVLDTRKRALGWISAQFVVNEYHDAESQRLRVVLDLLAAVAADTVLDGLYYLAQLAEKYPGGSANAALMHALVGAHARQAGVQSALTQRSARRVVDLKSANAADDDSMAFAETWATLARLPMTDVLRPLAAER